MLTQTMEQIVRRSPVRLAADSSRVITQLFVPGQEGFDRQDPRTSPVLDRLLALSDIEVDSAYEDVRTRFDGRHRDILGVFGRHAERLADRLAADIVVSDTR